MRSVFRLLAACSALALTACVPAEPTGPIPPRYEYVKPPPVQTTAPARPALPAEAAPLGRLPADVRPMQASLFLQIDPASERFSGTVEILVDLTRARDVIWLHGKDIHARSATVRLEGSAPVQATYGEVDASGVAGLRLAEPIGPGRAVIQIDFDAPFGRTSEGLYVVERAGKKYAFTQLEAVAARRMFPGFDEPAVKIPYDVTLFVPKGMEAVANTRELERTYVTPDLARITFATTAPLPSYLLAFAVGPLDVVNAPPIPPNAVRKRPVPLRGVAAAGRGKEMAYALAHTGEVLAALETYLGIEYPFDKLDILAVPDKRGAMENPGAVTFAEFLVLLDEASAPTHQKRAFWSVMFHELAHQWFGDLVTMPWWDDIWLNEAFATWATARLLPGLRPGDGVELHRLRGVQDAMGVDSLVSSRQVRQDVKNVADVANVFDQITYQKGGGVISMFERWMGKEAFRTGIASYLNAHRSGTATSDDLFAALTVAAGRDVGTPFRTFVNQQGVPLVQASLSCSPKGNYLSLEQSRHLPLGSAGDPKRTWQIPVCAKVPDGKTTKEACMLFEGTRGSLPLPTEKCPAWVMPNAGAAGYYVFSMPPGDMKKLTTTAWKDLDAPERLAVVHALRTSFSRGTPVADVLPLLVPLATQPERHIAQAVMEPFRTARSWLTEPAELAAIEKQAKRVFAPAWKAVGWGPAKGKTEDDERRALRADLLAFMAFTARDAAVRKEAAERGRDYVGYGKDGALHPEAADKDLLGTCLMVAAEEADAAFFEHLSKHLDRSQDDVVRARLINALGVFRNPELARKALAITLSGRLRAPELTAILETQLQAPTLRDAAFRWFGEHVDELAARRPPERRGNLPWIGAAFCDRAHADALSTLFAERIQKLGGGPRNLAGALEAMNLCAARRAIQEPSFRKVWSLPAPKERISGLVDPFAPAPGAGQQGTSPAPGPAPVKNKGGVVDPWKTAAPPGAPAHAPRSPGLAPKKGEGVVDPWQAPAGGARPQPKPHPVLVDPWTAPKRK